MCGRYTLISPIEEISTLLPGKFKYPEFTPSYNIAPSQRSLIVTFEGDKYSGELAKWGLLPHWMKQKRSPFINARSETVFVKPSFKYLYKNNRCVAIADGFYEWGMLEGKKQPVYFQLESRKPFAFAGFWEQDRESENRTFVIMTAAANEVVNPIHDRMPVILTGEAIEKWLADGDKSVLGPLEEPLSRHYVSTLVNSPRNNSEECITPYSAVT